MCTNGVHNPKRVGRPERFKVGGESQKSATNGQSGNMSFVIWPLRNLQRWQRTSTVARKWANLLHNPCCLRVPYSSQWGIAIEMDHKWANWQLNHCRLSGPDCLKAGKTIKSPKRAHKLHNLGRWVKPPHFIVGGQHQQWPINGQISCITPTISGSPTLHNGGQQHKWTTNGSIGDLTIAT